MTLDDSTFFQFSRTLNPGTLTSLPYHDHSDMAGNLLLLYALVVGYKAKRVLEIGTADGTSTLAFLKGAKEIDGHVVSIDEQGCPCAKELVKRFGLEDNWTFRQGNSHELLPSMPGPFDLILVDGDHSYEGTKLDIVDSVKLLDTHGLLLVHDCRFARDGEHPGTAKAVLELLDTPEWQAVVFPFSSNMGLFQRKGPVQSTLKDDLRNAGF